MVTGRISNLESLLEEGNGHSAITTQQAASPRDYQRKEYILFITDATEEIEEAANYVQEKLRTLRQPKSGLELIVEKVPDFNSAIDFWKEHLWDIPVIVADKRTRDSTGSRIKLVHSDVDHEIFTGVIDAYTVRTPDGRDYKAQKIDYEALAQTIINIELKEMRRTRRPLASWVEEERATRTQERRIRIDQAIAAFYRDIQLDIAPELASPEVRLSAVVRALKQHYEKQDPESHKMINLAGQQLAYLLKEMPPGLSYVTHSSKEGIFGLQAILEGKEDKAPMFAIKRFKELAQAQHVDQLSNWLLSQREARPGEVTYLNTPKTYWSFNVNGYSVVLMDALVGENLITLMPKINAAIKQKREEQKPEAAADAEMLKDFILRASLDNVAYWQHVSPAFAQSIGYQAQPEQIHTFARNALRRSAEVLEAVTGIALSKHMMENGASAVAYATSLRHTIGLDSGPRNIFMIEKEAGCSVDELIADLKVSRDTSSTGRQEVLDGSKVADAIFQVDIPYELRTVHELRDFVRLAYAPSNELEKDEISRLFAYWLLRGERLRATTAQERAAIGEDIYSVLNRSREPRRLTVVSKYLEGGPYDLESVAVAEAARMSVIIPLVFLSKTQAQLLGKLPTSMSKEELTGKFEELVEYNKAWARVGLNAASQLEGKLEGQQKYEIQGVMPLFETWEKAVIDTKKLPDFTPFMNI